DGAGRPFLRGAREGRAQRADRRGRSPPPPRRARPRPGPEPVHPLKTGNAVARLGRWTLALAALALSACGKRGDPLPPLPVTPQAVGGLKLAQRGDMLEISYTTPRATTGGARLGLLDIEILRADAAGDLQKTAGDFQKTAKKSKRRAAPGESLTETSPLPAPGTTVRVAARAIDRGRVSALSAVVTLVVQAPPPAPHDLVAQLKEESVAIA